MLALIWRGISFFRQAILYVDRQHAIGEGAKTIWCMWIHNCMITFRQWPHQKGFKSLKKGYKVTWSKVHYHSLMVQHGKPSCIKSSRNAGCKKPLFYSFWSDILYIQKKDNLACMHKLVYPSNHNNEESWIKTRQLAVFSQSQFSSPSTHAQTNA